VGRHSQCVQSLKSLTEVNETALLTLRLQLVDQCLQMCDSVCARAYVRSTKERVLCRDERSDASVIMVRKYMLFDTRVALAAAQ
jgi:hypothetical protein